MKRPHDGIRETKLYNTIFPFSQSIIDDQSTTKAESDTKRSHPVLIEEFEENALQKDDQSCVSTKQVEECNLWKDGSNRGTSSNKRPRLSCCDSSSLNILIRASEMMMDRSVVREDTVLPRDKMILKGSSSLSSSSLSLLPSYYPKETRADDASSISSLSSSSSSSSTTTTKAMVTIKNVRDKSNSNITNKTSIASSRDDIFYYPSLPRGRPITGPPKLVNFGYSSRLMPLVTTFLPPTVHGKY